MGYEVPWDDRVCSQFGVRTGCIFAAVWRGILGFNLFIYGTTLLHYNEHATYTFTYALMARDTDVQVVLLDVHFWAIGFCVGGMIQMLLSMFLFYIVIAEQMTRTLLLIWMIISSFLCAIYLAGIIYVIHTYEMERLRKFSDHQSYPEFIFFALPFIGEVFHMYFIMVVRCMYTDMKEVPYAVVYESTN